MLTKAMNILLVEDNEADIVLTREALSHSNTPLNLEVVQDGESALRFLRNVHNPFGKLPDLILLDLNLPGMNGMEVLENIKADTKLRTIPVIILSTSTAERDISCAYQRHANTYICKPFEQEQYAEIVQVIEQYWKKAALARTNGSLYSGSN